MAEKYDHKKIEQKWREVWEKTGINNTDLVSKDPKFYNLIMFPYPSGEYLHIGHAYSDMGADVYGRHKQLNGFNVFMPIGYDAFGLPAENFAIKAGVNPKDSTASNIEHAEKQLKSWGCLFDWSHKMTTSEPSYYKWTQWLFLKLYEKGLAYQKEAPVNWCLKCMTVLANEQVIDGLCERCDAEVIQKNMKQWFFKITDYADRLIKDLDKVDWPESSKIKQKNWIGRSEGVEFKLKVKNSKFRPEDDQPLAEKVDEDLSIEVFTTRIDTVYGMTYVVLAPEHPLVGKITTPDQKKEVEKYLIQSQKLTDIERQSLEKEKTGVFTGSYAINPFNNEAVPVWIADYVIYGYGTGAVMAVPAHDERDLEFAKKYKLPTREAVAPYTKFETKPDLETEVRDLAIAVVHNPQDNTYLCLEWKTTKWRAFPSGGTDGEDTITAAKREVLEETGYKNIKFVKEFRNTIFEEFYRPHKNSNVIAHSIYLLFELENDERQEVSEKEKAQHEAIWVKEKEVEKFLNIKHLKLFWESFQAGEEILFTGSGKLVNSGEFSGLFSEEAKEKMADWLEKKKVGKTKINYRLHDWSIGRQRYWGDPIPIVYCEKCGVQPVPEKDLPVKLPEKIKDFRPKGTGKGPLASVPEFVNTTCPKCGGKAERETDTMDTFVDSSFYYLRYPNVGNDKEMMAPEITKKWLPVDMYVGGAEHVTMHLLYARFITKVLHDAKLIKFDEPFIKLRHQGMILGPDGKKMSKSKGNIIIPDEVVREHGADVFRTYILFMGRFEDGGPWNPKGLVGVKRFLEKVWKMYKYFEGLDSRLRGNDKRGGNDKAVGWAKVSNAEVQAKMARAIKKVGEDIEEFKFNTAIAALMKLMNEMSGGERDFSARRSAKSVGMTNRGVSKEDYEKLLIILSPFAPFMAEELWERLGNKDSIHVQGWPEYDEKLIQEETVTIAIQVNGKVRDQVVATVETNQDEALELAKTSGKIQKYLDGKEIKKVIYVKGKLLSLVVS